MDSLTECREAFLVLVKALNQNRHQFCQFSIHHLSIIANILSHQALDLKDREELDFKALIDETIQALAESLSHKPSAFKNAYVLEITLIFKALAMINLYVEHKQLVELGLSRLKALCRLEPGFKTSNLETLGNLCMSLLLLAQIDKLSRHRGEKPFSCSLKCIQVLNGSFRCISIKFDQKHV